LSCFIKPYPQRTKNPAQKQCFRQDENISLDLKHIHLKNTYAVSVGVPHDRGERRFCLKITLNFKLPLLIGSFWVVSLNLPRSTKKSCPKTMF
jgi:hypothetical protein